MKVYRSVAPGPTALKLILHVALAADEAGENELRDRSIERASTQPKTVVKVNALCKLANLLRAVVSTPGKELDLAAVDKVIQGEEPAARGALNEVTGRFLLLHGDKQKAQAYLKAAIQSSTMSQTEFNLAWGALKNLGADPRKLREVVRD